MPTPSQNTQINDRIVKFDQLMTSIEQYAATIRNRTDAALSEENLVELVKSVFQDEEVFTRFIAAIVTKIGMNTIINAVSRQTRDGINERVDAAVAARLSEESLLPIVNRLIQMHASGDAISIPDIPQQNLRPEEIQLDSSENIARVCALLAGADAIL